MFLFLVFLVSLASTAAFFKPSIVVKNPTALSSLQTNQEPVSPNSQVKRLTSITIAGLFTVASITTQRAIAADFSREPTTEFLEEEKKVNFLRDTGWTFLLSSSVFPLHRLSAVPSCPFFASYCFLTLPHYPLCSSDALLCVGK